ncbi:MAG: hypothetical protein HY046_05840 [Acidobacteria bacterium]|nr:hypothetical protein [Acidobacteriota bacterium]
MVVFSVLDAGAQKVVDRVAARIENDIITESDVRELGQLQRLVNGNGASASRDALLRQLTDQWIVTTEADAAKFSRPSDAAVEQEALRLKKQLGSTEDVLRRLSELGLSETAVKRWVGRQLYLSQYLDYKFRPAAQIDQKQIEEYYRSELLPKLATQGEKAPPSLDSVSEQIREVLTQKEITARAERWIEEARGRLRIEIRGETNR